MENNKSERNAVQLVSKDLELMQKVATFNELFESRPRKEWVKLHPFNKDQSGQPIPYIPISVFEEILRKVFQRFKIEVLQSQPLFNSIAVTVRVHYVHPVTGEWMFQDGVGAVDVQVKKGSSPAQLENINNAAIQKGLPAAKSYAVKNAMQVLGNLLGGNLARKDDISFGNPYEEPLSQSEKEELKQAKGMMSKATNLEDMQIIRESFPDLEGKKDFEKCYSVNQKRVKLN